MYHLIGISVEPVTDSDSQVYSLFREKQPVNS